MTDDFMDMGGHVTVESYLELAAERDALAGKLAEAERDLSLVRGRCREFEALAEKFRLAAEAYEERAERGKAER